MSVGRAPAVGALAAWRHSVPPFSALLLRCAGYLPAIAALADGISGLAAARILSLIFTLLATTLLWVWIGPALQLRRAAFFACALLAVLGPTLPPGRVHHLRRPVGVPGRAGRLVRDPRRGPGRGDRAGWSRPGPRWRWPTPRRMLDAPVRRRSCSCSRCWPRCRRRAAGSPLRRAAILLIIAGRAPGTAGLLIGGSSYLSGFEQTIAGAGAAQPTRRCPVLAHSWYWAGLLVVLAVGGVVISCGRPGRAGARPGCWRSWPLAAIARDRSSRRWLHTAALAEQARRPGCLVRRHRRGLRGRPVHRGRAGRAGSRPSPARPAWSRWSSRYTLGASQSWAFATSWPNATSLHRDLPPAGRPRHTGRLLVEDPSIAKYYLPSGQPVAAVVQHPQHRPALRRQHRRARPPRRASSAPATPADLRPSTSPRATSPTWPSTSPTPPPWTTAWPPSCTTTRDYHIIQVVPYGI